MIFKLNKQEILEKIEKQQWMQNVYENMLHIADEFMLMEEPFRIPEETQNRVAALTYNSRISILITAGKLTGKQTYIQKAIDYLLYVAKHVDLETKWFHKHLTVADATMGMVICYDLLEDDLTQDQKEIVLSKMNLFATYLYECNTTWGLPHKGVQGCNHNTNHFSALGMAALVLKKEDWLEKAIGRVEKYLIGCADDTGYIPEGISYNCYGMTNSIIFSEYLKIVTGKDLIANMPSLEHMTQQLIEHSLPRVYRYLALSDNFGQVGNSLAPVYLASRLKDETALYLWYESEAKQGSYGSSSDMDFSTGPVFPFILAWADENLKMTSPGTANRPLSHKFTCGRAMARTAWDDEFATAISVTCGYDFHRGHNQPDQGSFTIYSEGEDFIIDPGRAARLDRCHSGLFVNGYGQHMGISHGEMLAFEDNGQSVHIVADITESINWESLVGFARRNFLFVRYPIPMLIIRDDIQTENDMVNDNKALFITRYENEVQTYENYIDIIGEHHQNKCRIQVVYPEKVTTSKIDEITEVIHVEKDQPRKGSYKECSIQTHARNPYFTTVITFAKNGCEFPNISSTGTWDNLDIVVENDKDKVEVKVERFDLYVK